ncbi:MAG TPA: VC0807 family protein [Stackebrandtia sp.]|jgi:hypothetical protein|uniref:VC0807 family protein n=1 Tax=Stackebrandtia sp. TaxID=2023065 RepID=UPI002D67CAF1|nr:VC0807 family protein [Stackebrandtia sp.]HZE41236.1 VC0807 family protein [Stackebrandtia sp.]
MSDNDNSKRGAAVIGILLDVLPPLIAYFGLRAFGVSTELALLGSTAVAALRVIFVAALTRQFDAIAGFVMAIYGLSAAMTLLSGDQRILLLRDSITTGVLALGLLISFAIRRPLIYYAAKRAGGPAGHAEWETRWANEPGVRHTFMTLTMGWGLGLLAEALVRVPLIYVLKPDVVVGLSTVLQIATVAGLVVWSIKYVKGRQARANAVAA